MAIRYDQTLLEQIRRTVKNYQAKRQRVLAKGGEIIPDPASVSTFLNDYTSRRELLKDLRKLQRYSVRGAEQIIELESGQRLTRYDLTELKRLTASAKRNITIELKAAPQFDTMQPMTRGYYENLRDRYSYLSRNLQKLTPRQFKIYERIAHGEGDLEKKHATFYENIRKMLNDITYGLPDDIKNRFMSAIDKLNVRQLTDLVSTNPYLGGIIDWYTVITSGGEVDNFEQAIESLTEYINAL